MFKLRTLAAATLAFAAAGAFAQAASTPTATPRVDQRQANQEKRIDQGVASGELNKRETRRLTKEQHAIDRAENHAKADGTVTKTERRRLHKMQKHAGQDIHQQKHDAQTAPVAPVAKP
jgi:polyhydroxyalkanoate synthesis regulator phasin